MHLILFNINETDSQNHPIQNKGKNLPPRLQPRSKRSENQGVGHSTQRTLIRRTLQSLFGPIGSPHQLLQQARGKQGKSKQSMT